MDVYELVEAVDGEIVNGVARVRSGRDYIILGRVTPEGMVMTEEGKTLVDEQGKPEPKKRAPRKAAKPPQAETQPPVEPSEDAVQV